MMSSEFKADTLFGVYCQGNPTLYITADGVNWDGWQRVADYVNKQLKELEGWKESAIAVTPNWQDIGKEIGVRLGDSVHDKVLPALVKRREALEFLHETFANDIKQGYVTKDKQFAVDVTKKALEP